MYEKYKKKKVVEWDALHKWSKDYFSYYLPSFKAHAPNSSTIRTHHTGQPFGELAGLEWKRPWKEAKISSKVFFEKKKLVYFMTDLKNLPKELIKDLNPPAKLYRTWRPPIEVNLWMGTPTVATPTHFDM